MCIRDSHQNDKALSTAESILHTIRSDRKFTDEEAKIRDLCMIIHADHGGGNNSTFTTRCITSTGTDTYSAIAAGKMCIRDRYDTCRGLLRGRC